MVASPASVEREASPRDQRLGLRLLRNLMAGLVHSIVATIHVQQFSGCVQADGSEMPVFGAGGGLGGHVHFPQATQVHFPGSRMMRFCMSCGGCPFHHAPPICCVRGVYQVTCILRSRRRACNYMHYESYV